MNHAHMSDYWKSSSHYRIQRYNSDILIGCLMNYNSYLKKHIKILFVFGVQPLQQLEVDLASGGR